MRKRFALFLFLAVACFSLFAGENRWTIKGPDGGPPSCIAFDPVDPTIVYAATTNGLFRSSDGGQHWTVGPGLDGTTFGDVIVASGDPRKVFASTGSGLYKSSDRGLTWSVVNPAPSGRIAVSANGSIVYIVTTNQIVIRSSDGGTTFGKPAISFPDFPFISGLVMDPQNSDTVYASFSFSTLGVYKTTDAGAHWRPANRGLAPVQYYSLLIDPSSSAVLYAGAGPGRIFKTTDAGESWHELTNGLDSDYYASIAISPRSSTIVTTSYYGVYKSTDGGASWTKPSLTTGYVVAIDPVNASNILLVPYGNLVRSTDGGSTFTRSAAGLTAARTSAIVVDPRNESIIYTCGASGIFKSVDRGETWTSLHETPTTHLAVDPFNSQTIYAITSAHFRRSLNGGVTWEEYAERVGTAWDIAADPRTPGTLYTLGQEGPYKKVGEAAWTLKNSGLPRVAFASFIRVDPANSSVLYLGTASGLYKSVDGGDTWTFIGSVIPGHTGDGIADATPGGLSIDPFDSNHLLSWWRSYGSESTNGGATWTPFPIGKLTGQSGVLAFDPLIRGRIYNSSYYAVERSNDAGKTWLSLTAGIGSPHGGEVFVISPTGTSLYFGGWDGGVWMFHESRTQSVRH
ncbi:MAG TPA: hypothetical protein VGQ65_15790 [Thermoanaerobaculia bacterium]|nr:hypothetical protein [Thermoanaerobaculia bacterium]